MMKRIIFTGLLSTLLLLGTAMQAFAIECSCDKVCSCALCTCEK